MIRMRLIPPSRSRGYRIQCEIILSEEPSYSSIAEASGNMAEMMYGAEEREVGNAEDVKA